VDFVEGGVREIIKYIGQIFKVFQQKLLFLTFSVPPSINSKWECAIRLHYPHLSQSNSGVFAYILCFSKSGIFGMGPKI